MNVNEALAVVQKMGSLDRAEFSFDEQRLFETDLSLHMPSLGLQLCFDGYQQDLRVVTVRLQAGEVHGGAEEGAGGDGIVPAGSEGDGPGPPMLPPLAYNGRLFAGTQQPALSFRDVYKLFGPTWIGDYESGSDAAYFLRYPGLTFEFPLPEDMVEEMAAKGEHPMEVPGHPEPTAVRMWIYASDSPSYEAPCPALPDLPEAVIIKPAAGVELRGRTLRFGSMPQDVFSDFGPPEQVCMKDMDAVRIHSARGVMPQRFSGQDYFYNYFHLGLDVLFDGRTHIVKKVVLHTNPPTHELFSRYARCFFQILLKDSPAGEAPAAGGLEMEMLELEEASVPTAFAGRASAGGELSPLPSAALLAAGADADTPAFGKSNSPPSPSPPASPKVRHEPAPPTRGRGRKASSQASSRGRSSVEDTPEISLLDLDGADEPPADAPSAGEGEDEEDGFRTAGNKKMSKKERKAAKKAKKGGNRMPTGTPSMDALSSPGCSPDLSALTSSAEPSPLLNTLCGVDDGGGDDAGDEQASRGRGIAAGADEDPAAFDILPPPAMPLDGLDGVSDADDNARGGAKGGAEGRGGGGSAAEDVRPSMGKARDGPPSAAETRREGDVCIGVQWPWPRIQEVLGRYPGCKCGKPLVMNQTGSTPFGSTYFYAFPGLAFEVMQNGFVASVAVFKVPQEDLPPAFQQMGGAAAPPGPPGGDAAPGQDAGAAPAQ